MERQIDQVLDELQQDLLRMGADVRGMVSDALRALIERDDKLVAAITEKDREVDRKEKEIDEVCHLALAKFQPTAVDLRFLVAAMKITSDLERIGDSAVNIAQSVSRLNPEPPLKPYIDLPALADLVGKMIRDALDAMVNRDVELALAVCRRDDQIDSLYRQLFRELLTFMMEDPRTVSRALHLLLVARNLERIGDHATNIAEDVIYYVEGRDIRHEDLSNLTDAN